MPYAQGIGGEVYRGMPGFKLGMEARGLAHNRAAILKAMNEERRIIDVGPDFAKRAAQQKASPNYEMERMTTQRYSGYEKAFERSGQSSVIRN